MAAYVPNGMANSSATAMADFYVGARGEDLVLREATLGSLRERLGEQQRRVKVARQDVLEHAVMARQAEANRVGQDELELHQERARFEVQQKQQQEETFALMSRQVRIDFSW